MRALLSFIVFSFFCSVGQAAGELNGTWVSRSADREGYLQVEFSENHVVTFSWRQKSPETGRFTSQSEFILASQMSQNDSTLRLADGHEIEFSFVNERLVLRSENGFIKTVKEMEPIEAAEPSPIHAAAKGFFSQLQPATTQLVFGGTLLAGGVSAYLLQYAATDPTVMYWIMQGMGVTTLAGANTIGARFYTKSIIGRDLTNNGIRKLITVSTAIYTGCVGYLLVKGPTLPF